MIAPLASTSISTVIDVPKSDLATRLVNDPSFLNTFASASVVIVCTVPITLLISSLSKDVCGTISPSTLTCSLVTSSTSVLKLNPLDIPSARNVSIFPPVAF